MKTTVFAFSFSAWLFASGTAIGAVYPHTLWTNRHPSGNVVLDVSFTPDGASVVSGSASGPALLWNVASGASIRTFAIPLNAVAAVAVSPDGLRLAGGGGSGGFRIWRVSDGSVLASTQAGSQVVFHQVVFSPDGSRLARASQSIGISDATNLYEGLLIDEVHSDTIRHVVFSPDSRLLGSSGDDNRAALIRVSDGQLLRRFDDHPGPIAFTPDGRYFVFGNMDGTATFWDLQTNGVARVFPGWGSAVKFSPDSRLLLAVDSGSLKLWRVSDGMLLVHYDAVTDVRCIDISPDGKLFAYGGGALVLARMPTVVAKAEKQADEFKFDWQGGSGRYQVQQTSNVVQGPWANLGPPTTATNLTVPATNPAAFFRIQSLTNAP